MFSRGIFSGGAVIVIRRCFVALCRLRQHIRIRQCFSSGISSHGGSHRLAASRQPRGSDSQLSFPRLPFRNWLFSTVSFNCGFRLAFLIGCFASERSRHWLSHLISPSQLTALLNYTSMLRSQHHWTNSSAQTINIISTYEKVKTQTNATILYIRALL